ncbi:MAG: hypothetical protein KGJ62_10675 [Armatimonadetes bacterium]|nr:hypothetical protein [Armatimonadota bacterium]MDE2207722.1 hypothetical protein [Armatimonadota bacterium]
MPVEIAVCANDSAANVPYSEIAAYLSALPGVVVQGNDFTYRDEETGVFFVAKPAHGPTEAFGADADGNCDRVLVRIPGEMVATTRTTAADFCAALAAHFNWKIIGTDGAVLISSPEVLKSLGGGPSSVRSAAAGCGSVIATLILCAVLIAAAPH